MMLNPPQQPRFNSSSGAEISPTRMSASGVRPSLARPGFTLVITLVILAAVTILVVGLYGIVSRETQTSASYVAVDQADLAVQAGLDRAGLMLKGALTDELGVVFSAPLTPNVDDKERTREMLMAANYDPSTKQWKYQPLASGVAAPISSDRLKMPAANFEKTPVKDDPAVGPAVDENPVDARRLPASAPWMAKVPRYWMQLRLPGEEKEGEENTGNNAPAEDGKIVARYSFYVEDLQGKLNLANAGEHSTEKNIPYRQPDMVEQVEPANPDEYIPTIPGLIIDKDGRWRRNPASVWTLLRPDLEPVSASTIPQSMNALHRRLTAINSKRLAFSPDMWKELAVAPDPLTGWAGIDASKLSGPEARLPNGSLADTSLRALEENTTGYLAPYDELALIPYSPGFEHGGERKLNLNKILTRIGADTNETDQDEMEDAVEEIAAHIDRQLPDFKKRAGGYPLPRILPVTRGNLDKHQYNYLKCLAAGMIDYADKDSMPSINSRKGGNGNESNESNIEYRGTDSFPLISEYWQRYRFEVFKGRSGEFSLTDYAEIWNPTNQVVEGWVSCCFEYKGRIVVGFDENYEVSRLLKGEYEPQGKILRGSSPSGSVGLEGHWYQPQYVKLQPNEIRVLAFPSVFFELDGGALGNVTNFRYKGRGQPGYQDDDVDGRYRLAFSKDQLGPYNVVDMPLQPVERYGKNGNLTDRQTFNVCQPGLAYRLRQKKFAWNVGDTRAAYFIDYHQEEISYTGGSSPGGRNFRRFADDTDLPGENKTYMWPDGGHNTIACRSPIGDTQKNPDDANVEPRVTPRDNNDNGLAERQKFVQPISNAGRFYSMTELGHIFDPIMWDPDGTPSAPQFGSPEEAAWADDEVFYYDHADLKPSLVNIEPSDNELNGHKRFCGGNSLRIGRMEHSLFRPDYRDIPESGRPKDRGLVATSLLDLFHCGDANSINADRITGDLLKIDGHVNVNTATRDTLRALIAGRLVMDPQLKRSSEDAQPAKNKPVVLLPPTKKAADVQADIIASAIIQNRPYTSPAEVAEKAILSPADAALLQQHPELPPLEVNKPVFGYTRYDTQNVLKVEPEWTDAAAEESFGRLWNNSTVRSRHFQVVVCGQAVKIGRDGQTNVVATRSRIFHVFIKPVRAADGTLQSQVVEVTYSRPL